MIADTFGWNLPYAQAILQVWKFREAYCRAVLAYSQRVTLSGEASDEEVDEKARAGTRERLAAFEAKRSRQSEQQTSAKATAEQV